VSMWLEKVERDVAVNGTQYPNGRAAVEGLRGYYGHVVIEIGRSVGGREWKAGVVYRVTVLDYMCKVWSFNDEWNGGVPMPATTLTGTVDVARETRGMIRFHGQGWTGWIPKKAIMEVVEV